MPWAYCFSGDLAQPLTKSRQSTRSERCNEVFKAYLPFYSGIDKSSYCTRNYLSTTEIHGFSP